MVLYSNRPLSRLDTGGEPSKVLWQANDWGDVLRCLFPCAEERKEAMHSA
jgi:hypothetical protein